MRIDALRLLRGPNIFSMAPCCVAELSLADSPAAPGASGAALAAAALGLAEALQRRAGAGAGLARADPAPNAAGRFRIVLGFDDEKIAEGAVRLAVRLLDGLARGQPLEAQALDEWDALGRARRLGPGARSFLAAAGERDIPVQRVDADADVFQLGWGRRQQRLSAAAIEALPEPAGLEASAGRIPLIAITGTNGKTTTTQIIGHALRRAGRTVGMTTTQGIFIDGRQIEAGDCTGFWSARTVLASAVVEVAVLETARGGILKRGLGFDRCAVGVVLNVASDHLGLDGIETLDDLAVVKGLIARCAASVAVLNAEDPRCVAMAASLAPGCRPVYFAMGEGSAVVAAHCAAGGGAACLEGGWLVWREGAAARRLVPVEGLPAAMGGHARHNVANALAAAAALASVGLDHEAIAAALASFVSDARSNPLRGNRFDVGGVAVIVDYAHNLAACEALCATARSLIAGTPARCLGVITAPGDRRSADLMALGSACASAFDELIVYEVDPRGRAAGETTRTILEGARLAGGSVLARGEPEVRRALALGLARSRPGDLLVFTFAGPLQTFVEVVRAHDAQAAAVIERDAGL